MTGLMERWSRSPLLIAAAALVIGFAVSAVYRPATPEGWVRYRLLNPCEPPVLGPGCPPAEFEPVIDVPNVGDVGVFAVSVVLAYLTIAGVIVLTRAIQR